MMTQPSNELYHHGILGQKWGVRRTEAQLAKSSKGTTSSKKVSAKEVERNKVKSMSDTELRQRINRIQMEKQYKNLTSTEISSGKRFVNDVISQSGKKVATAIVTGAILYGIKAATSGQFDLSEMGSYMSPKPKNK